MMRHITYLVAAASVVLSFGIGTASADSHEYAPSPLGDESSMCHEALPSDGLVVLASRHCAPCRRFGRALREVVDAENAWIAANDIAFLYTDCSRCGERSLFAERSGNFTTLCAAENSRIQRLVETTPTVLILKDGDIIWSQVGAPELETLRDVWTANEEE
jgi:hypothetical protein